MHRAISIVALLLLFGCDSGSSDPDYFGIYDLVSVNGLELPAATDGTIFSSGAATLNSNESFELSLTLGTNPRTVTISGRYEVNGKNVSYIYNDEDEAGEVDSGTLNGEALTLNSAGVVFAYSKR